MNKNIIIAILIVIIIAVVGFTVFSHQQPVTQDGKISTQINFLSQTTLKNGDQVQFELKDAQGAVIAGQPVTISYKDGSGNVQNYTVNTDQNGKGYLTLNGEEAGNYDITVNYAGNDKYSPCTAKQTITIEEGTSTAEETVSGNSTANTVMYNNGTSSSSSSSDSGSGSQQTSSASYYDADLNVYYDSNGNVIGGQSAGSSIYELRQQYNNPDMIDEDGNLQ
ncbi:Ig-like domain-containing protein [Methanobrevibacter sp.]|uniref:Ig-like domain-containing protein n=1 Tax=Methanobrevibacter sp. TaxID=66852 RepID=UPI002E778606|nr:Ig-like domain repeat protein [Methanobrevibacter sp.]MEE1336553.1 Ig-like domain-containing protein [Methanobrevibacter sp.]